jgi:uncharacterized Zn finger protein
MYGYRSGPFCPVCSSSDVARLIEPEETAGKMLFLCHCNNCGCTGDFFGINDQINELLHEWFRLPEDKK